MCLLITALAAIICFYLQKKCFFDLKRLCVMFSSATIMWIVDRAFAKFNGEDFFDLSYDDTLLGITVVFLAVFLDLVLKLPKIAQNSKFENN